MRMYVWKRWTTKKTALPAEMESSILDIICFACDVRIEFVSGDGNATVLKEKVSLLEGEVIVAFARVAGTATATATIATLGALNFITGNELFVTGEYSVVDAATAVVEDRFGDVAFGDGYLRTAIEISDRALFDRVGDRFADMFAVATQKPLPVD